MIENSEYLNDLYSLLKVSIKTNQEEVIEFLVKKNLDLNKAVDDQGNTYLHFAMNFKNKSIINILCKNGANPLIRNKEGKSCFVIACEKQRNDITAVLLDSISTVENNNKKNPYSKGLALLESCMQNNYQACQFLIQEGAFLQWTGAAGNTALHIATLNQNTLLVNLLIKSGASLKEENVLKQTFLDIAINTSNIADAGFYILIAAKQNDFKNLRLMFEKHPTASFYLDEDLNSAVFYAINNKNEKMVKYLIEKGIPLSIENRSGISPKELMEKDSMWKSILKETVKDNTFELEEKNSSLSFFTAKK